MNNIIYIAFSVCLGLFNNIYIYLNKIPYICDFISICKPYLIYFSCNVIFYYGKLEILYQKISPNEKQYEYLSLYCVENSEFINCNSEIVRILRKTDRTCNYLLKFRKCKIIGRLHILPEQIIKSLEDIELNEKNLVLSAIYKETTDDIVFEKDITELLNEYLICNFNNTFKLSNIIENDNTIFNNNGKVSVINNLADIEVWDINTII
jgi:hypothetical protein